MWFIQVQIPKYSSVVLEERGLQRGAVAQEKRRWACGQNLEAVGMAGRTTS